MLVDVKSITYDYGSLIRENNRYVNMMFKKLNKKSIINKQMSIRF